MQLRMSLQTVNNNVYTVSVIWQHVVV